MEHLVIGFRPINDPVGLEDDLPNGWDAELRDDPPSSGNSERLFERAMSARPRAFTASALGGAT